MCDSHAVTYYHDDVLNILEVIGIRKGLCESFLELRRHIGNLGFHIPFKYQIHL